MSLTSLCQWIRLHFLIHLSPLVLCKWKEFHLLDAYGSNDQGKKKIACFYSSCVASSKGLDDVAAQSVPKPCEWIWICSFG